jgi:hydroxymethylpyrimidine pyrophosphatase-like HAD family hydrolase
MIPPLFYLPMSPSKPYTLVIDLDGTLIYYNEDSRILKYRPYMDRFLAAMQKHF